MKSGRADTICFLPIDCAGAQTLAMMHQSDWSERMRQLHDAYLGKGFPVCGMLDCRLKELYCCHAFPHMQESGRLLLVCFDWQEKLAEAYFADLAGRMEAWIQKIPCQAIADWFAGAKLTLPWKPRRLACQAEGR